MLRIFILLFIFPLVVQSQVKKNKIKGEDQESKPLEKGNGFLISGNVQGFPDGTPVSFLNQQTGAAEQQAVIQKGKFINKRIGTYNVRNNGRIRGSGRSDPESLGLSPRTPERNPKSC